MSVARVFADVGQLAVEDGELANATLELAQRVGPHRILDATATTLRILNPPTDPFSPDADRLLEAANRAQEAISDMAVDLRRRRRKIRWNRASRDRQYKRGLD